LASKFNDDPPFPQRSVFMLSPLEVGDISA